MANSLNSTGNSHAGSLISQGKVDKASGWSMTASDENALLGDPPNWTAYGKWFLGKDASAAADTKAHWKYPFGKNGKLYRSAVIAIKQRAGQQGDTGILDAAGKLLERIDGKEDDAADSLMPSAVTMAALSAASTSLTSARTFGLDKRVFEIKAQSDKSADIYLYDSIGSGFFGGVSAESFVKELKALGKQKLLNIYINSDGGDVFDGVTIYQNLVRHPAEVRTHVDGLAASIASYVAMAGNTITIADGGMMMIHNPWGLAMGEAVDLRKRADTLDQVKGSIVRGYSRRTGLSEDKIAEMMDATTWMTASEALELSFVSAIEAPQLMAASAACPFDLKKFRNAPSWYGKAPLEQPRLVALRAKRGQLFAM